MARTVRLFEIIQVLRSAKTPLRADDIACDLGVSSRTIYRDVVSLQAMRVPIEGAAGVGYVMRAGYDLPPVNFDIEEAEAVSVGLGLVSRTGDQGLIRAAKRAGEKLSDATVLSGNLFSSSWGPSAPGALDLSDLRAAIREERKVALRYENGEGDESERKVLPVALVYHTDVIVLGAWCELRQDLRNFRPDRMLEYVQLEEDFKGAGHELRQRWLVDYAGYL